MLADHLGNEPAGFWRRLIDWLFSVDRPTYGAMRDGRWPALAKAHLQREPWCIACGRVDACVPHHVVPVHAAPQMELEPDNLVTLCPVCHLLIGHGRDWRAWNPHVRADCALIRDRVRCRKYARHDPAPFGSWPAIYDEIP